MRLCSPLLAAEDEPDAGCFLFFNAVVVPQSLLGAGAQCFALTQGRRRRTTAAQGWMRQQPRKVEATPRALSQASDRGAAAMGSES